ncbi:hypothetical protein CF328_g8408 [Tilletia controversa]|nr:hypothetical protein CF328_g8408 [Tilletia controversa]
MSTSSSTQQRHADKIDHVFQGLKSQNLSFGRFVQGVLNSKNSEIKAVVTKWLRLSNSIEESIGGVEDSARKFGPEDVLDALVAEVNNRSDSDGVKRLNQALMAHARPLMVQEVEDLCANDGQWLRVPSINVVECSRLHQSLSPLADFYRNKLPSLFQFLSMLIGKTQDKQEGDAVHQDDVAQQEEAPGALSEEERIILPCISSILFARNRLLNRFQMLVGVLLATHFAASKSGKDGCLDRVREILRRGRTALREDKPLFNEGWEFGQEVWEGRLQAMLESVYIVLQLLNLEHDPT